MRLILALACSLAAASAADLVRIPSGRLEIPDQVTTLKVTVTISDFLLGPTEVTQREYEAVTGANPSVYKGADRPVESVSWWDALRYTNLLSRKAGLEPCYDLATGRRRTGCNGFRLPTESEWMRAAGPKTTLARLGHQSTTRVADFEPELAHGTFPVASMAANSFGLYDMYGNVWEWCEDYWNPVRSPDAVLDPTGPLDGLARVIRGGSFVSTTGEWSREYRSSMDPAYRSRFTGFRVARSLPGAVAPATVGASWFERFNQAPKGFESSIGGLKRLVDDNATLDAWRPKEAAIRARWAELLHVPKFPTGRVNSRFIKEMSPHNFTGRLYEVETEPGIWVKAYVLRPANPSGRPMPVVIVPFYDIDVPAAADFGGRNYPGSTVNAFAYSAAQRGYIAVAVRWYGESEGEWYSEAVANLALRHPGSTGLGKWVADSRRLVDFIETLPDVDATRIGMFGHSLGGKMTLYASALDPRIRAAVSSELGIGFKFSNYQEYWYLGERLAAAPPGTDQHELIALMAPRPFLLIGGDKYDGAESWHYINAARAVYKVFGKPENVGMFNHHTGHSPSPEAVNAAFDWLDHWLKE